MLTTEPPVSTTKPPVPTTEPPVTDKPSDNNIKPKTGDDAEIELYIFLIVMASIIMVCDLILLRKRKSKQE
jgi:uncharacterized surface anchored protein